MEELQKWSAHRFRWRLSIPKTIKSSFQGVSKVDGDQLKENPLLKATPSQLNSDWDWHLGCKLPSTNWPDKFERTQTSSQTSTRLTEESLTSPGTTTFPPVSTDKIFPIKILPELKNYSPTSPSHVYNPVPLQCTLPITCFEILKSYDPFHLIFLRKLTPLCFIWYSQTKTSDRCRADSPNW